MYNINVSVTMNMFLKTNREHNVPLFFEPYFEYYICLFDLGFEFTSHKGAAVKLKSLVWYGMVHTRIVTLDEFYSYRLMEGKLNWVCLFHKYQQECKSSVLFNY